MESEYNNHTHSSIFTPLLVYVTFFVSITILQIAMTYFINKTSPSATKLSCDMLCCVMCCCLIYLFGNDGLMLWVCTGLLISCTFACCVSAITGSSLSKYQDPIYVINMSSNANITQESLAKPATQESYGSMTK